MHTEKHGTETHLDKVEARAGSRNKTNRNALVAGLILVVIVLGAVLAYGYFRTDRSGADEVTSKDVPVAAPTN